MARKPYPSDLSDTEWKIIKPLLPQSKNRGRPMAASFLLKLL
nr:hypothetical protein [Myxosarcina sp. GI1]